MYPDNFPLSIFIFPLFITGIFLYGGNLMNHACGAGWAGTLVGVKMGHCVGV